MEPDQNTKPKERSRTELLGDEMKAYEKEYEVKIPGDHAFIVRADGHSFSKFTRGFHQPFDENFKAAMINATADAVNEFHASTGYTHSDEITLIFPPMPLLEDKIQPHPFNGRVCKLLTLISSFIAVRFNYHLLSLICDPVKAEKNIDKSIDQSISETVIEETLENSENTSKEVTDKTSLKVAKIVNKNYTEDFIKKIKGMHASFDARILDFPPEKFVDISRHMVWRSLRDCTRNAVFTYARQFFSANQLNNKNSVDLIEMMKTKNFDYENSVPDHEKIGTYLKKELYMVEALNPQTNQLEKATRCRVVSKTMRANTSPEFIELLLAKYF